MKPILRFSVLSAICFLISCSVFGQGIQKENNFVLSEKGQFFALSVKNLDESSRWYQQNLGFKSSKRMVASDSSSRTEILTSGSIVLEIVQQKNSISKDEIKKQPDFLWHGIFKVGIFVDDIQNVLDNLNVNAVPIFIGPVTDQENKTKYFMIRDNSRNIIQFFESIK